MHRLLTGSALLTAIFSFFYFTPAMALDSGHVALVPYTDDDWRKDMCPLFPEPDMWPALPDCYLAFVSTLFYHGDADKQSQWVHKDIFDAIFVFDMGTSPIQQGWTVKQLPQTIKGIGRDNMGAWDNRTRFGVPGGNLRIAVNMGTVGNLPDDTESKVPSTFWMTGAELMGHEFGHYYMASITYKKDDVTHCWIRGNECTGSEGCTDGFDKCDGYNTDKFNQHWSYYFNSQSVMYGSTMTDNKDGTFLIKNGLDGYSQLDQYLMGLRSAESIDQELYIVDTSKDGDPVWGSGSVPPMVGNQATITGKRIDFTMDDVIAANGNRNPQRDPCHWKAAFILAYPQNKPPTENHIKKVDAYRKRWETYYDWATSNKGSFDTTLNGHGPGTTTCPAPNYPDGGYPPDDAGYDGGVVTDSGIADGGVLDAGKTDGGAKDGSVDSGTKPDGAVNLDSGTSDDSGTDEDASEPEDDAGDAGKKKKDGGTTADSAAGCSCSMLAL